MFFFHTNTMRLRPQGRHFAQEHFKLNDTQRCNKICNRNHCLTYSWPSDAIWWHRTGSILARVMTCCLTAHSGRDKIVAIWKTTFICIFLIKPFWISNKLSWGLIGNVSTLTQIMAWHQTGAKRLSDSMMTQFTVVSLRHLASMCYLKAIPQEVPWPVLKTAW